MSHDACKFWINFERFENRTKSLVQNSRTECLNGLQEWRLCLENDEHSVENAVLFSMWLVWSTYFYLINNVYAIREYRNWIKSFELNQTVSNDYILRKHKISHHYQTGELSLVRNEEWDNLHQSQLTFFHILFSLFVTFFHSIRRSRQCRRGFYRCLLMISSPSLFCDWCACFLCLSELFFPHKWSLLIETAWQTCLVRMALRSQMCESIRCKLDCVQCAHFVIQNVFFLFCCCAFTFWNEDCMECAIHRPFGSILFRIAFTTLVFGSSELLSQNNSFRFSH